MEHISQIASRLAMAAQSGTACEEVSLLKAYLELATIIIDRNNFPDHAAGANKPSGRVLTHRAKGPSALQNATLQLRQP